MKYKLLIILFIFILNCSLFKSKDNYCTEEPGDVWSCRRYFGVTMSPDGDWVAFIYTGNPHDSTPKTDTIGIYLFNLRSFKFINLLTDHMLNMPVPYHLDFSPDGEWIVFSWQKQIWKIKINGDSLTQLTFSGENFYPRWSPDAKKIIYHVLLGDSAGIWMINIDGSTERKIGKWGWSYPEWDIDNEHIIFVDWEGEYPVIAYADTIGQHYKILLRGSEFNIIQIKNLEYSPDGSKILFVARRPGEGPMVWVMDADGSNPVPLARGQCANWSNDGEKILYTQTESCDIWIMDKNGCNKVPFIGDFNFLKGGK